MIQNCTKVIELPTIPCHFFEFPDSRVDRSDGDGEFCVKCNILGRFLTGGTLTNDGSEGAGRAASLVVWILTILFGVFGALTNCINIAVVTKRKKKKSFDLFLIALAIVDFIGSVTAIMASTAITAFLENWNKGLTANISLYIGIMTCLLGRSGSSFMTVLITLERHLIITFPMRSRTWFTPRNAKFMIAATYLFAVIFLAVPRYTSVKIVQNDFGYDVPSLRSWSYLMVSTPLAKFWYGTLGAYFVRVDFWVPLPALLILNFLIFLEIRKFAKKRKEMNVRKQKDIQAVKMFVPIVAVLFLCNIEPFVYQYMIVKYKIAYREMGLGIFLSVAVNSSVNMPIYYFKGTNFRQEVKELFTSITAPITSLKLWGRHWSDGNEEKSTRVVYMSSKQSDNSSDASSSTN